MNRILRATWHDYRQRAIYMLTLNKNPLMADFGSIEGDWRPKAGEPGCAYVRASHLGRCIKDTLRNFDEIEPRARILQYALMPDHLHILIFITERTEETLGRIVARFKVAVNKRAGADCVFAKGFNDQILKHSRSLHTLYNYLRDNPRRLAVRLARPEYFRRVNSLTIGSKSYRAYGNPFLLRCPFKEQVVVHRADTEEVRASCRAQWLYTAAGGGVLVSPFISPAEKDIRREADEAGGRFILITNESMGERYKPSGRDFELCEEGRMLIVSADIDGDLSRAACLRMNSLAEDICAFVSAREAN